jgi:hypothetical protein
MIHDDDWKKIESIDDITVGQAVVVFAGLLSFFALMAIGLCSIL